MDDHDQYHLTRPATSDRPLAGLTILLVEDSRFACEAFRLMCQHSGARLRRADSLSHARQHLRTYRPAVVIIDLGLPDGAGESLIAELARAQPRVDVILATSGDPDGALRGAVAGADGFIAKPIARLSQFQTELLRHLPRDRQPKGPRLIDDARIQPDQLAYRDDLSRCLEVLDAPAQAPDLDYVVQFLTSVALAAGDHALIAAVNDLSTRQRSGTGTGDAVTLLRGLLRQRLEVQAQIGLQ